MRTMVSAVCVGIVCLLAGAMSDSPTAAQTPRRPTAALIPTTTITLPGASDSNSPAVWDLVEGRSSLFVFTSFAGWSNRLSGGQLASLVNLGAVTFTAPPPHGMWFEAIIPDADGTWYGYYHNERPADICGDPTRMLPRIGAARSTDFGATWEDLGIILEAPPDSHECATTNRYFVGGVGDFSVVLDQHHKDLYFFFSQYVERVETQGVAVARLPWAARNRPRGRVSVWWQQATWAPPRRVRTAREPDSPVEFRYPSGVPIFAARDGWHDGRTVDAYWGPSVHWNTYLQQYVMLLNHASDSGWRQEGIYISYAPTLDDPGAWSPPQRLLSGGDWYPQVIGLEAGAGTDRLAGERARFFMSGRSRYLIQFTR